ncbi:hypothetical protein [Thalassobius sp. MITS945101]|uniref:hypothetical protein n=1 Tax=Thalassobius sp. MITS945101 TaxID=3096994 RepID=UPI00399958DE
MSETDSFIEEVSEEVRRDRLYKSIRRYGWIAVVGVVAIVGGASWNEYNKAQARAAAEALGDGIMSAMDADEPGARADALAAIAAEGNAAVVLKLQQAAELEASDRADEAIAILDGIASNGDVAAIYRDIAGFKSILLQGSAMEASSRRIALESLVTSSPALRILAEEQLALLEIEMGETSAALERLERIAADADASTGLRRRVSQLIVALGGERSGA